MTCLLVVASVGLKPMPAQAQNGQWTSTANGNWSDTNRWLNGIVADGTNNTADVSQLNITQNRTITVDTPRTISDILIRDTSGGQTWTFSGANVLTLANDTLKPQLRVLNNSGIFNVVLDGVHGMRKEQAGILVLNAANIYSGDTEINRGTLQLGNANAIPSGPGKGNVIMNVVGGNPILDIGSVNPRINGLSSTTPNATVNSSGGAGTSTLTVGDNDANGEFGGVIANGASRTVALTKIGAGTQSLTNVNTYTGPTTITGGRLQLVGSGSIAGSSAIRLGGGATFDVSGVDFPPYAIPFGSTLNGLSGTGTIEGSVNLDSGAFLALSYAAGTPTMDVANGTLTLGGNDVTVTITGSPLVDGSYKLISKSGSGSVAGAFGTLTLAGLGIVGGGTPSLALTGDELYLNIIGGAPVLEWGSGDGTWADGVTGWNSGGTTAFTNGNAVLLTDKYSTGSPTITLNSQVLPQGVVVDSTNNYTLTGTGEIGGPADLRKLNTGALTLDTANTHSGGVTLFEGTLNLKNAAALGDVSGTFTINGGTLDNTSGGPLTLNNNPQAWNGNFAFAGSSDLNLGTGDITLASTRTVTVAASTLAVGGSISGTGFGLVKNGAGTLALNADNTFTGGVTINEGEIIVNNAGALNSITPVSVTMPNDTADKILSLNGNSITVVNLTKSGFNGAANAVVRNNHATTPVTLTVSVASGSVTYAGTLADGGATNLALTKIGSGTWKLGDGGTGVATYSGDTTVSVGTLLAGATDIFPHGADKGDMFVASGATLDTGDRGQITLNGLNGGGLVTHSANSPSGGNVLRVGEDGSDGDFSGVIQNGASPGPNFVGLTKLGAGTQILRGANTYTGPTTISGGVLQIGNGAASGSLASPSILNNASLVFNRGGNLTYSGAISGNGALTNDGPGVVSLTGASTYTGPTTVNAGTLRVNSPGSLAVESTVTVKAGATLGGTGTINGPVTVEANGTLAPGTSIGTLTINNNVSLQGTTAMEVSRDSGSPASDRLIGVNELNYGGDLVVTKIGLTSLRSGDTFDLFDATTINPDFNSVSLPALLPGLSWTTNLVGDGSLSITGTVIPPQFSAQELSGDTLTLSGTGGVEGQAYYVLTSTDVNEPVANWTPLSTNLFEAGGNFSFPDTVNLDQPQRFYLIAIP